ncbi:glycosyltransferase [Nitriliruptor alkaliphilus]|uniref:glycosyltransferase n=1 Tax=Nitriliruptor alkaliphilus TaxID=427918 RepID=UPI000695CA6E|nr:glycosyltransferase family 2 protein [Nitriliruptor alkaliphilus]
MTAGAPPPARDDVRVAVVVVSHETRDEALGCLASIPSDVPAVLVDTGSRDGTAAAVRAAFPHVRVLELANAGFGRGANAGVRATDTEVAVVANADVRFDGDGPAAMAAAATAGPEVGLAGPRVVYPDGRPQASARALPDPLTAVLHALLRWIVPGNRWTARYRQTDHDPTVARDVGWVSGCALAVRRTAFDAVDGFDPGYPLYLEDVDLAARLQDAGWRVRYDPRTTVVHRVGASTSGRRWRALVWHARGLDRYVGRRYGASGRALRPLVRLALAAWVVVTYVAERSIGRGRSTTGE